MQKQHYFGRNNLHLAEMRIFRPKLLFLSNTAWPGPCIQTGQMCDAGWREGINLSIWQSHIILVKYWCRDCFSIFVLPCPKRWRRWRQIWGVLEPEWYKFQLIFCIYHLDNFPSTLCPTLSKTNFGAVQNPNQRELGLQIGISCGYVCCVWCAKIVLWYLP